MSGATLVATTPVTSVPPAWQVVGAGDFNDDGRQDLFWRNTTTGEDYVWLMNGSAISSSAPAPAVADPAWKVVSR